MRCAVGLMLLATIILQTEAIKMQKSDKGLRAGSEAPAAERMAMDMSCTNGVGCPFSYDETCDPAGQNTGGSALELLQIYNCSVWTQNVLNWPQDAYGGQSYSAWAEHELPKMGFDRTTMKSYMFADNPAGVRVTTMSGQCFWTTPGCDPKSAYVTGKTGSKGVYSPMELLTSTADNYEPLYLMSRACMDWGGCTGSACDESSSPVKGSVKIYQSLKCAVLQWSYPLPKNRTKLAVLTDSVGNKYVQHAFDEAIGYADPDPENYPDGWEISYMDFSTPEADVFRIYPYNPSGYCDENAYSATEGNCLYTLAQDFTGIGYHRFYWSGQEPLDVVALDNNRKAQSDPVLECKAYCEGNE